MIGSRVFALSVLLGVAIGCSSVPLTAPTGAEITITSDRTVLPLNGTATLRAVVIESGGTAVHNGTVVTFTATLGSVTPIEAKTVNGVATATFSAGSVSGKSSITAFSGGALTGTATEITIGSAAAKTITVSATPSSVSQSGGTVTVAAQVLDESGNVLPGVNVTFSADVGQLNPTVALSDASGVARTQLTTTQTSKVKATAGTATSTELTVTVSAAPNLSIEVQPASPTVGVAAAITISAPAAATNRQIQTLVVDFGDGNTQTVSNPTGSVGLTHTYQRAGGYTITARSTDVAGNTGIASRAIVVQPAVITVSVSANPSSGTAPFTTTISGSASAASGAPPIQSVRVLVNGDQVFSTSGGGAYSFAYRVGGAGTYNISTIATDTSGNEARASTIVIAQ